MAHPTNRDSFLAAASSEGRRDAAGCCNLFSALACRAAQEADEMMSQKTDLGIREWAHQRSNGWLTQSVKMSQCVIDQRWRACLTATRNWPSELDREIRYNIIIGKERCSASQYRTQQQQQLRRRLCMSAKEADCFLMVSQPAQNRRSMLLLRKWEPHEALCM